MTPSKELAREIAKKCFHPDEMANDIEPLIRSAFEKFRERAAKILESEKRTADDGIQKHFNDDMDSIAASIRNMEV